MPFLQTSRAPILPFLLVSFLLFLLLSPFHEKNRSPYSHHLPLHYLTLRSQRTLPPSFYSTHIRPPIYILNKQKRVLCRLYHVCRLQNHLLLLPSHMKQYSRFLRTQCALTNPLVFSSHRSLNKLNQTFNHDWIAPNTPYHQLQQYIRHHLPSFYSSSSVHVHSFHSFEKNNINATCLLPSATPTHPLSSHCPNPPELTITYPAILLNHHDTHHPNHQQLKQQLITTYQTIFKQQLKILHSESVPSSSDTICFRSIISSPPETIANDSDVEFSTNTNVTHLSKHEMPFSFERLVKKIAHQLTQAFFDESPTPRKKHGFVEYSTLGRMGESKTSDFKDANDNRSLRKLLADKSAKRKSDKSGKGAKKNGTVAAQPPVNSTANFDILSGARGKGQKKNSTFAEHPSANPTAIDTGGKSETENRTITEHSLANSAANMNVLNTNNTKSNNSNQAITQNTANRTANEADEDRLSKDSKGNSSQEETLIPTGGSFDDVDLEDSTALHNDDDDYLPTFQYLLDYNPNTNANKAITTAVTNLSVERQVN